MITIAIDVSNTLGSSRRSGLQRLCLRVAVELSANPGVDLVLLDGRTGTLRTLSTARVGRLSTHFERPVAGNRWSATTRRVQQRSARSVPRGVAWTPQGGWLVDLDPAWHAPIPRTELLGSVQAEGTNTAAVVPDLLPVHHPEWFPPESVRRFTSWLVAHRVAGSRWIAISDATADALRQWLDDDSLISVLRLGVDLPTLPPAGSPPLDGPGLILAVGTVEPRKGHGLLLDALDKLGPDAPVVDVVGSAGWAADDLRARLRHHPKVRWHTEVADGDLEQLWRTTGLLVQPTSGEGFGLPVAEALARGIPVMATDLPVLAEASQRCARLVAPTVDAWAEVLSRFADDATFRQGERRRAQAFVPWSWADTADDLIAALDTPGP